MFHQYKFTYERRYGHQFFLTLLNLIDCPQMYSLIDQTEQCYCGLFQEANIFKFSGCLDPSFKSYVLELTYKGMWLKYLLPKTDNFYLDSDFEYTRYLLETSVGPHLKTFKTLDANSLVTGFYKDGLEDMMVHIK